MYSKEDFHRDIELGISIIRVVADQLNLNVEAEEFIQECHHPDGETYWHDAINAANHDINIYKAAVVAHFFEWVTYPDVDSVPKLKWRDTETRTVS